MQPPFDRKQRPNATLPPQHQYGTHKESQVDNFSNTSEDAYGLQGAFAEIADSIDRANDYIFIAGWMFEPWLHLPCYGEYLRKGLTLQHQGNLQGAIKQYTEIINKDIDNNGYSAFFLAHAHYQQGDRKQAQVVLQQALQKHPAHKDLTLSLARLYLEEGLSEKAKELISPLLKQQDLDAYTILAEHYKQTNQLESAQRVYENVIRLDTNMPPTKARLAYQGLGDVYLLQKNHGKAEENFRRCLYYYPQDIRSLIGLAQTLKDNPEKGQESIQQIDICYYEALGLIAKNPNYQDTELYKQTVSEYALWAEKHIQIGGQQQFDAYLGLMNQAIEANPNDAKLFLAKLHFLSTCNIDTTNATEELLSECARYLEQQPNNKALHQTMIDIASKAEDAQYDALIDTHRRSIEALGSLQTQDEVMPVPKSDLRAFNHMSFDEGMRQYRDTLPSLGETLIRKALANPNMVVAVNLWQQYSAPNDTRRYKHPIRELKKIAADLGLPFPNNLLIRTNHCRDFLNTHHQKYIVMDNGKGDSTAYVGSCDLSGKFEWADHPIINTAANDNALDRYYLHHNGESMRDATRNTTQPDGSPTPFRVPRGPWREIVSKIRGSVCYDLLQEFKSRWIAKSGGALSGHKGADDDENLVATIGAVETRGSLDLGKRVIMKVEEVFNKVKLFFNKSSWNTAVEKYHDMLKSIPGESIEQKNTNPAMQTPATQEILKDLYREAYQRFALHKKELFRLQQKYPDGHVRIQEGAKEVESAKQEYDKLIARHLMVSSDAQKQCLDEEPEVDSPTACCTKVIRSTQKSYYNKSSWQLGRDVDSSIQDAYIQSIKGAQHFIYIENQYFTCDHNHIDEDPIVKTMLDKIIAKAKAGEPFHIYLNIPYAPNGEPGDGMSTDPLRKTQTEIFQYMMKTIEEKTGKSWSEYLSINFFAQWNGVVDEQGAARLKDGKEITRAESQSLSQRAPIYNHSKMMNVDGTTIINGSANISRRSLSGKGDTELAIIQTPDPDRPESKKKMEAFLLKIVRQYYGDCVADKVQERMDAGLDMGLAAPEIRALIQQNTWSNLASFSANEPGQSADKERGFAVSFPYNRERGHPGEVVEQFQFIPDAPRDKNGKTPDIFRWVPEQDLTLGLQLVRSTGKTD